MRDEPRTAEPKITPPVPEVPPPGDLPEIPADKDAPEKRTPTTEKFDVSASSKRV
jgi:hypothetical protein